MKPVPKVGEYYHFWDDGKTSPSRHYICKCERVITLEEAKNVNVKVNQWDYVSSHEYFENDTLYHHWQNELYACDWLFAEDTDYVIECSCPKYDHNNLWFVRTKEGGWFSMDIQSGWQGGELDVDGKIYESIITEIKNDNGDISVYENETY